MLRIIVRGLLLVVATALSQSAAAENDVHALAQQRIKLAKSLAVDYEKLIEPGNTTLRIGLSYVCAHYDLTEKRLHSRVFERYSWNDWRLTWDPKEHGGVKVLKIPSNLIWTPDVQLFNAFEVSAHRDDVNVVILHDGTVYWIPSASYTSLCGPGEKKNDRKGHCHLSLGSWTYDASELPLALFEGGVEDKYYLDDCPHIMSNIHSHIKTSKYDCCPNPYASIEIDFDLEPRSEFKSRTRAEDTKSKRRVGVDCQWPKC